MLRRWVQAKIAWVPLVLEIAAIANSARKRAELGGAQLPLDSTFVVESLAVSIHM
jgi:hypothetical protein